jgi:GLPGLI family protein
MIFSWITKPRKAGIILFSFFLLAFGFVTQPATSQITAGKVVYERKTNIYKKFKDWDGVKDWIREEDHIKVDTFELFFNDSLTAFKPQESDIREKYEWATDKNQVYQNFKAGTRFTVKSVWGENVNLSDTLYKRTWKITDSKRIICGYPCRKAIWQADDTTRFYAWFSNELQVSAGPESFYGLPGLILGLATEDGGVIYFAKSVDATPPQADAFEYEKGKKKIYTVPELKSKLEKEYGKEKWGKAMLKNLFGYW